MSLRTWDRTELREIRDLLLDRRRVLEFDLAGLESKTASRGQDGVIAPSSAHGQLAELVSNISDKALLVGQLESQSGELSEVRDALDRLGQESFGLCDNCGDAIPVDRLRAIPYARLCMSCKSAEEAEEKV